MLSYLDQELKNLNRNTRSWLDQVGWRNKPHHFHSINMISHALPPRFPVYQFTPRALFVPKNTRFNILSQLISGERILLKLPFLTLGKAIPNYYVARRLHCLAMVARQFWFISIKINYDDLTLHHFNTCSQAVAWVRLIKYSPSIWSSIK